MKRFVPIATLLLAMALPAAAGATAAPGATPSEPSNVTTSRVIQRDLRLASEFWAIEQPTLQSPCLADQVVVTTMVDGVGVNGQIIAASNVWAETQLGGCTIDVAPVAWALGTSGDSNTGFMMCVLIAHEYGHTLGLPDSEEVPMMSNNWGRRDDPLCDRAVYGWKWTLHRDRMWIAANRRPLRMARRAARRQAIQAAEVTAAGSGASTTTVSSPSSDQSAVPPSAPAPAPAAPNTDPGGPTGPTGPTGATS